MNFQSAKTWLEDQASGDIRVWILAIAVCMLFIYLIIGVIFGGYGGHRFEMMSKLKFLENSSTNYYGTQDELESAREAWKARAEAASSGKRLPAEAYQATPKSVFEEAKTGVILQHRDYANAVASDQNAGSGNRLVANGSSPDTSGTQAGTQSSGQSAGQSSGRNSNNATASAGIILATASNSTGLGLDEPAEEKKAFAFDEPSFRSKPVIHAYDVELVIGNTEQCAGLQKKPNTADMFFRVGSAAIKGVSLEALDTLIDMQRQCPGSVLTVSENPHGMTDTADRKSLIQRRRDEIKYHMHHRRVPKELIHMKENS